MNESPDILNILNEYEDKDSCNCKIVIIELKSEYFKVKCKDIYPGYKETRCNPH